MRGPLYTSFVVIPALLAVLWAQLCGLDRGFWCFCDGGLPRLTQADHSHEGEDSHHPLSDHAPGDPVDPHTEATERLMAKLTAVTTLPHPPSSAYFPVVWWNDLAPSARDGHSRPDLPPADVRPPAVAGRATVLLI